mgnify:CR=1 FL=1
MFDISIPFKNMNIHEIIIIIDGTAFHLAIQKENIEIIRLLLKNPNINVNIPFI